MDASVSAPQCSSCEENIREIERLQQEVASRDAELRELRFDRRDQVKVLQESKQEVTRAKVKLRRLATRADAASYIAEVEIALQRVRASRGGKSGDARMVRAQHLLESTEAPFVQGDYGMAMDRAAEAEQLIISTAGKQARTPASTPAKLASQSRAAPSLKTTDARKPSRRAPAKLGTADTTKTSPPVRHAYQGSWTKAEAEAQR